MQIIRTAKGDEILVDDDVFDELNTYTWRLDGAGYAIRSTRIDGKVVNLYMHKLILNPPPGMWSDHKDLNKLNNQRTNLRSCTPRQNNRNKGKHKRKTATSKFKGVSYDSENKKWIVSIMGSDGVRRHLGRFRSEIEAARVYNEAAKLHHGEFASLNEIGGDELAR